HYYGKLPMAIVTGSRRKPVEMTLTHLGLNKYFDHLVCAEDYVNGKPAPDCFLLAAKLVGVDPAHCLVFEDAPLGVQAALNAGMECLLLDENQALTPTSRAAQSGGRE
ncbi:MAG: HAD family hydrolase, partial [Proteobacteria bacterium]